MLNILKAQGKTIVIAEHRMWYLKELADRVLYIKDGKIEKEYTMRELDSMSIAERMETGIRPVSLYDFFPIIKEQSESSDDIRANASIQMKNVYFSYKKYERKSSLAVPEVCFSSGTVIAVIGNNGAGKSTLVSVIAGLLKNEKGVISVNGTIQSAKERLSMSYMVMQEVNHQLFTDSVKEEIVLGIKNPDTAALNTVLNKMDIEPLKDRHPMTLSGGQKQRVAIAAAIFCKKKILIFDEPTSGLDFFHMTQTAELIKTLKADDTYIFVITHDYEFIVTACDIVVEVKNGGIEAQYPLDVQGLHRLRNGML